MAQVNAFDKYQEQTVSTATPGMLIIMLFDNAVKNLNTAMKAIDNKKIEDAHNAIIKVEAIYSALLGYLNDDIPISANLKDLYSYILKRLVDANMKKDKIILKEVLDFTIEFRDTWKQAETNLYSKK